MPMFGLAHRSVYQERLRLIARFTRIERHGDADVAATFVEVRARMMPDTAYSKPSPAFAIDASDRRARGP